MSDQRLTPAQVAMLSVADAFPDDDEVRQVAAHAMRRAPEVLYDVSARFGRHVVMGMTMSDRDRALQLIADGHPKWAANLRRAAEQYDAADGGRLHP